MKWYVRYSVVATLVVATFTTPLALSAQSLGDIQSQINALLAQVKELQAKLKDLRVQQATSTPSSTAPQGKALGRHRVCKLLVRTLREGLEGDDVRSLQEFLIEEGFFTRGATGHFGSITRDAVRRWQAARGIASNGDENTTGWGLIGPRTRALIMQWCVGGSFPTMATTTPVMIFVGATSTTLGNLPPTVSGFAGPATLLVNQSGTWTVQANDAEGQQLSYFVSWGDGDSVYDELLVLADLVQFTSATTSAHAYSAPGQYTITLHVRDGAGGFAAVRTSVRVGTSAPLDWIWWDQNVSGAVCTLEYEPVCGRNDRSAMIDATYANRCIMTAAGATFLNEGQCSTSSTNPADENDPSVTGSSCTFQGASYRKGQVIVNYCVGNSGEFCRSTCKNGQWVRH